MEGGGEKRDLVPGVRADGADEAALSPNMEGDAGEMEGMRALGCEDCRSLAPRPHALSTYATSILHLVNIHPPSINPSSVRLWLTI